MISILQSHLEPLIPWLYVTSEVWTGVGFFGSALFGSRFVVQWFQSERQGMLVVPSLFWQLSFWGSLVSLVYALHVDKLPIIISYVLLPLLHGRNLWLLHRSRKAMTDGNRPNNHSV